MLHCQRLLNPMMIDVVAGFKILLDPVPLLPCSIAFSIDLAKRNYLPRWNIFKYLFKQRPGISNSKISLLVLVDF